MCWSCASDASGGGALHWAHGAPTIINPMCTCQWILDHSNPRWPSWVPNPKCHHCDELLQEKLKTLPPPPPQQEREFFIGPKTLGETLVTQEVWRRLRKLAQGMWATEATQKDWVEWHLQAVCSEEKCEEKEMLNILLEEEEHTCAHCGEVFLEEEVLSWGYANPTRLTITPSIYDQVQAYAPPQGTPLQYRDTRP